MAEEKWDYILINGKYKQVQVKNPKYSNGTLAEIEALKPFDGKDGDGKPRTPTHEDAKKLKQDLYSSFFKKPFKNLLVLSGAGSSMDVGGPSMNSLWTSAGQHFTDGSVDGLTIIKGSVKYDLPNNDIEALISIIEGHIKFVGDPDIVIGTKTKKLSIIKDELFKLIQSKCTISKPAGDFPHKAFLEKLLQRKLTNSRVKIFTTNYDLLFEHAANEVNAIVIDGFSFTIPRTFSGRYFDYDIVQREGSKLEEEDNFIQRVFHLHKLHGSINWHREESKVLIKDITEKPLMIYPREGKYEDSYEQPFFEMMARFQRNLRINNDTMLLCIGYSFNDKHINAAIEEALNQNPSFRIAVIDPGFDSEKASDCLKTIKKLAMNSERVIMIAETFGEFAKHFPEIKTYENDNYEVIDLKNAPKN